jgi:peptidyl-prolyl cis-trans isomerase SurA
MLLFESMEEKVWGRSTRDTLGLKSFYEANKESYRQKEKVKARFLIARNSEARKFLLTRYQDSPGLEEFEEAFEEALSSSGVSIERQSGLFDPLVHPWLSEFENLSPLNALDLDNAYVIALIDELVPSFIPELRTIRGQVINDYQEWLEKEWLEQLKAQFPVLVNKEAFDGLEKEFVQGF